MKACWRDYAHKASSKLSLRRGPTSRTRSTIRFQAASNDQRFRCAVALGSPYTINPGTLIDENVPNEDRTPA
jgi:hypothetical protein